MKILGIIAEYNPFHNGHLYHLKESKSRLNADGIIIVMSGNFLQRGEPALLDKWERTRMALAGGADIVIELPVLYALRSAEFFAYGGISLLDATGVVDYVSFGSESGDLDKLQWIAKILADEPAELSRLIRFYLEEGLSFPAARTAALRDYIRHQHGPDTLSAEEIDSITANPNNILALEYIKAIHRLESPLIPVTIPRIHAGYHDTAIEHSIASATAIRENLLQKHTAGQELFDSQLLQTLPGTSQEILHAAFAAGKGPIFTENFSAQILTLIRRARAGEIAGLFDVRGGLEHRIKEAADQASSIYELVERIKTRRFTWTRIQRTLFHLLLNLTSIDCEYFDQLGGPQYLRILGFTPRGQHILARMKDQARLPLITRTAKSYNRTGVPEPVSRMLGCEIQATNLYSLAAPNPAQRRSHRDLKEQVIIWK